MFLRSSVRSIARRTEGGDGPIVIRETIRDRDLRKVGAFSDSWRSARANAIPHPGLPEVASPPGENSWINLLEIVHALGKAARPRARPTCNDASMNTLRQASRVQETKYMSRSRLEAESIVSGHRGHRENTSTVARDGGQSSRFRRNRDQSFRKIVALDRCAFPRDEHRFARDIWCTNKF